jgi:hypothetical protein
MTTTRDTPMGSDQPADEAAGVGAIIDGGGHLFLLERPAGVAGLVAGFAGRREGPR